MKFEDFIRQRQVKRASKDIALVRSLIASAHSDLSFLSELKIDDQSARKIISNYYDILRSILEAISALDGYKVYSHEAFTYFLKEKGDDLIAQKFDRFRKIRNKINYYGKNISVEEAKENSAEMIALIEKLRLKYLGAI